MYRLLIITGNAKYEKPAYNKPSTSYPAPAPAYPPAPAPVYAPPPPPISYPKPYQG